MAWSSSSRGGPSASKRPVELLDLTLSPSPEPQPQSNVMRSVNKERARSSAVKTEKMPIRRVGHQSMRPIHPDDIKRIVNTSDLHALRTVMLHLCELSPALSGAVARGLSRHSTYAQGLIRQRPCGTVNVSRIESERDESRDVLSDDDVELLSSPKITPLVKRERKPSPVPSDGSSSTAFSDERSRYETPPPRTLYEYASAAPTPEPHLLRECNRCKNCNKSFSRTGPLDCLYHPNARNVRPGHQYHTCCGMKLSDPKKGCRVGPHIAATEAPSSLLKRGPPHEQSSPFLSKDPKYPKLR